jgi:hypothetical protein
LAAHGFFAAQGFFAAHGFAVFFFAPDVFTAQGLLAAHGFFAAHGLAPALDVAGLAAHGLHGFAAIAAGAPSASETSPVETSDLIRDFLCKIMERSPVWG